MLANYHTHTPRCRHAVGTEREYIEKALEAGLEVLGFSDHTPYNFGPDYVSGIRMSMAELPGYVSGLRALRAVYADRLEMHIGLEAEYYPGLFSGLLDELRAAGVEYLILGQHFPGDEIGEPYCGSPTADARLLRRYVDQCVAAMETGLFSCLAHPDLIHYVGDEAEYLGQARRLCAAAKDLAVPLEINLLGLGTGRHYPREAFWRAAGETGCAAVLGCDAHEPAGLAVPETEARARALAEKCGVPVLETLPLRPLS